MHRVECGRVAQVPFADHAGGILGVAEHFGNRYFSGIDSKLRIRPQHAAMRERAVGTISDFIRKPGPHWVTPGHERGAGGRAGRTADIEIRKPPAFFRKSIKLRRFKTLGAEAADIGVTQVVCQNHDNVRSICCTNVGAAHQGQNEYINQPINH